MIRACSKQVSNVSPGICFRGDLGKEHRYCSMSTKTELLALCDLNWPHSLVSLSVFVISPKEQSPPRIPRGNVCVRMHQSLYAHLRAW